MTFVFFVVSRTLCLSLVVFSSLLNFLYLQIEKLASLCALYISFKQFLSPIGVWFSQPISLLIQISPVKLILILTFMKKLMNWMGFLWSTNKENLMLTPLYKKYGILDLLLILKNVLLFHFFTFRQNKKNNFEGIILFDAFPSFFEGHSSPSIFSPLLSWW